MSSLNETPRSERLHIALFGRRNSGKSSLINAMSNQKAAIVSDVPGTTTDPVFRAMEILPVGPVVLIDTAGLDDTGELGELRVKRTLEVLERTDLALIVIDAERGVGDEENRLADRLDEQRIRAVVALNKSDLRDISEEIGRWAEARGYPWISVSAATGAGVSELRELLARSAEAQAEQPIVGDLVHDGEIVVLVVPIDKAAPKGRLILPQVMTLRDALDHDAIALVVKERELAAALRTLDRQPKLVVTDSQAILKASADTPKECLFTTFSILMARHKGVLTEMAAGAAKLEVLQPGDRVLIAEACTHHRQPDDIGKVQIPRWLRQLVGGELEFSWCSGHDFPPDLESYDLVIHCGGCMINRREMASRLRRAQQAGVPMTNYGVVLAAVHGVLERALAPFPSALIAFHKALDALQ
ncbi:MAG: [FeFe] hydrogenase H-cluster maturation GTPase HydF [Armatimonadota bacterium]